MTALVSEHCVACRSDAPRVTPEEQGALHASIPDWNITERDGIAQLERTFRFKSYRDALAFVQHVGDLAEAEDHHPTMLVEWRKVTVTWWTHTIKGLHRNDFVMAAKTDAVVKQ